MVQAIPCANVLTGNGGNNILTGGDGVDTLRGGVGADNLTVGPATTPSISTQ